MEMEKSYTLPSASWRTRKANGIIRSKSKGLKISSADIQGQEKMDVSVQGERANSPFLCLLVLFGLSTDCMMPTHIGVYDLL